MQAGVVAGVIAERSVAVLVEYSGNSFRVFAAEFGAGRILVAHNLHPGRVCLTSEIVNNSPRSAKLFSRVFQHEHDDVRIESTRRNPSDTSKFFPDQRHDRMGNSFRAEDEIRIGLVTPSKANPRTGRSGSISREQSPALRPQLSSHPNNRDK